MGGTIKWSYILWIKSLLIKVDGNKYFQYRHHNNSWD